MRQNSVSLGAVNPAFQEVTGMTSMEFRAHVAAWRAQPAERKTFLRRETVVDEVVGSMRMEREPVSKDWELRARAAQSARLA